MGRTQMPYCRQRTSEPEPMEPDPKTFYFVITEKLITTALTKLDQNRCLPE